MKGLFTLDVCRKKGCSDRVIQSFRDKRTEAFSRGVFIRAFQCFDRQAYKLLEILDAATCLEDLRGLSGNRLEALKGDPVGQFSIRVNIQWRICFEWPRDASGPTNVEIVDYH
jgi:proteic killer suppression protein